MLTFKLHIYVWHFAIIDVHDDGKEVLQTSQDVSSSMQIVPF